MTDNIEGKGRDEIRYYCSNKEAAVDLAKGLGPMGCSDGYVTENWLVNNREDLEKTTRINWIRKEALAKLTKEEKEILNLI